jgi:tetratricopeptide (TPR) repeat protein
MSEAYDLFQKGLAALASGLTEEAIVPLERAKKLEPNSGSINEALGKTYFRLRFYDRALAAFQEILDKDPLEHYAHFCMGRCYERLGQPIDAQRHYKLASTLGPDIEVYRTTLARFLDRRDETG